MATTRVSFQNAENFSKYFLLYNGTATSVLIQTLLWLYDGPEPIGPYLIKLSEEKSNNFDSNQKLTLKQLENGNCEWADLDLTLLYKIIQCCCGLAARNEKAWTQNCPADQLDGIEQLLFKLKEGRNAVSHSDSNMRNMSDGEFKEKCQEMKQLLKLTIEKAAQLNESINKSDVSEMTTFIDDDFDNIIGMDPKLAAMRTEVETELTNFIKDKFNEQTISYNQLHQEFEKIFLQRREILPNITNYRTIIRCKTVRVNNNKLYSRSKSTARTSNQKQPAVKTNLGGHKNYLQKPNPSAHSNNKTKNKAPTEKYSSINNNSLSHSKPQTQNNSTTKKKTPFPSNYTPDNKTHTQSEGSLKKKPSTQSNTTAESKPQTHSNVPAKNINKNSNQNNTTTKRKPQTQNNGTPIKKPSNQSNIPPKSKPQTQSNGPPKKKPSNQNNTTPKSKPQAQSNGPPIKKPSNQSNTPPKSKPQTQSNGPPKKKPSNQNNTPKSKPQTQSNSQPKKKPSNQSIKNPKSKSQTK